MPPASHLSHARPPLKARGAARRHRYPNNLSHQLDLEANARPPAWSVNLSRSDSTSHTVQARCLEVDQEMFRLHALHTPCMLPGRLVLVRHCRETEHFTPRWNAELPFIASPDSWRSKSSLCLVCCCAGVRPETLPLATSTFGLLHRLLSMPSNNFSHDLHTPDGCCACSFPPPCRDWDSPQSNHGLRCARSISRFPQVRPTIWLRTSLYSGRPNVGLVIGSAGRNGRVFDPEATSTPDHYILLFFNPHVSKCQRVSR